MGINRVIAGACTVAAVVAVGLVWSPFDSGGPGSRRATIEETVVVEPSGARSVAWSDVTLDVRAGREDVVIEASAEGDGVQATFTGISTGVRRADAEAALAGMRPRLTWSADGTTVLARVDRDDAVDSAEATPRGRWTLAVPADVAIRTRTDRGDVEVRGVQGPISVHTDVGNVLVRGGRGGAVVTIDVGDADVSADGPVAATSERGTVRIAEEVPVNGAVGSGAAPTPSAG